MLRKQAFPDTRGEILLASEEESGGWIDGYKETQIDFRRIPENHRKLTTQPKQTK